MVESALRELSRKSETYLESGVVGEERFGLLRANRRMNNNIVAFLPVDGSGDTMLVGDLQS